MIILAKTAIVTIIPMVSVLPQTGPAYLPGPMSGPAISRIELPAPVLNPGLTLRLAPVPAFPALPIPRIPSRPVVPVFRPSANQENVRHPLATVLPGLRKQLSAPAREEKPAERRERLDEIFDGRSAPVEKPVVGEVFTLPENDLEQEIGAY